MTKHSSDEITQRIWGCLMGVACGDAMGMPTSLMSPETIREIFPEYITEFQPAPPGHPIHNNMVAGQITDDTQQSLLLADTIIATGRIDSQDFAQRLIGWAESNGAFNSLLVGPSSLRALHALRSGASIEESGTTGDTNGATMRVSAAGIFGKGDLERTVDAVANACKPTHNTNIAIAGASAVAIVIGAGIRGETDIDRLMALARQAISLGMEQGNRWYGASLTKRMDLALNLVQDHRPKAEAMHDLYDTVGAGVATTETVPLCLSLVKMADGDPVEAIRLATNLGGDCDTTAAIAGGMCGAISGIQAFPEHWISTIESVNNLGLEHYAEQLTSMIYD